MKIVYLYDSLAIYGGIERVLIDKMNSLVSQYNYDVYIITASQGNHPVPYLLDSRVCHIDLGVRFHQKYQYKAIKKFLVGRNLEKQYHKKLQDALHDISPDILICTTAQDVRSLLKIKGNIPLIVESHCNFVHQGNILHKIRTIYNNFWICKADAIVSLTEGDAKNWRYFKKDNVYVIPNVVHLNTTGKYSDYTAKRAIFVGRFTEQKGIKYLFEIWNQVHKRYPDWRLDMYGDGELWDYYKQMSDRLQINLHVHKPASDIFSEYIKSSMLLVTSICEPFGLVIPEAMSCGLPVIAFDCPYGPADIINNGENGIIVPIINLEKYVNAISFLIEDNKILKDFGKKALLCIECYNTNNIMPLWISLFKNKLIIKD